MADFHYHATIEPRIDAERSNSRSGWWARIKGAWRAMGGINIGAGQINLGTLLQALVLAAVVYFGRMVADDHDKLNAMAGTTSANVSFAAQITANSNLIAAMQRHQDESDARLDCLQGTGTVWTGCVKARQDKR